MPVALSTDDEGVSRIDLTHEYARAAVDFGLTYLDLKQMARTSLEHAFCPGTACGRRPDVFTKGSACCAVGDPGRRDSAAHVARLPCKANPRAAQQWELEHRFSACFERGRER